MVSQQQQNIKMKSKTILNVFSHSLLFFAGIWFYHILVILRDIKVPLPLMNSDQTETYLVKRSLKPMVYVITATYRRQSQLALLTRMGQTLQLTKDIHWLVVNDGKAHKAIVDYLKEIPVKNTLLEYYEKDKIEVPLPENLPWKKVGRGSSNRNIALKWLVDNDIQNGVIYIADDDNTYNYKFFDEIRHVKKVGLIPVGHFHYTGLSSFILKDEKIVDYIDPVPARKFPIDMACFVVNLSFWRKHETYFINVAGLQETTFLESMLGNETIKDLEPLAGNKLWAWHTKDKTNSCAMDYIKKKKIQYENSNAEYLAEQIICE